MPPRDSIDDAIGRLEAQEIYRRIEALAVKIETLGVNIAVLTERQKRMEETVEKVEKECAGLNKLANRGMGILLALTLLGGALGGFWDRIVKLFTVP